MANLLNDMASNLKEAEKNNEKVLPAIMWAISELNN